MRNPPLLQDSRTADGATLIRPTLAYHTGPLKSRAEAEHRLTDDDKEVMTNAKKAAGKQFSIYVKQMSDYELTKDYPDRYPSNRDSIGIEVVGKSSGKPAVYPSASEAQIKSVRQLVEALKAQYGLSDNDVYKHPQISRKTDSEASNVGY